MNTKIYKAVVKNFIDNKIKSLLKDNYFFLNHDELKLIKEAVKKVLIEEKDIEKYIDTYFFLRKKKEIFHTITEQLQGSEITDINGFVTFRMKYFENALEDIFDKIVEFHMVSKEYEEFIKLLKYFVEIQDTKIETLIVKFIDDNYLLEDINGNNVKEQMEGELNDIPVATQEDKLVSVLISSAPKNIIIKNINECKSKELIDVIKQVFENKLQIEE